MEYRITKDCGTGWDESLKGLVAWGASETQHGKAEKVSPGDIFLHFIDHARAWAGYSIVSGVLQPNNRDFHADWLAALPYVIPIEPGVWLEEYQCEHTVSVSGLSDKHYHRQTTFTRIPPNEAELIIEAIKTAKAVRPETKPSAAFHERWKTGAESYYKGIVKGSARGKCWLCEEEAASWATRTKVALLRAEIALSKEELASIRDSFLDAAHIVAHCDSGSMTPDNLRPLCPTCHRIIDRLSNERREKLLRKQ